MTAVPPLKPVLWDRDEAAAATGATAYGDPWQATGVSIDSRSIEPGDLFIALRGPNNDGHRFAATALAAGAAAALVDHHPEGAPANAPCLIVEDTAAALWALAAHARARTGAQVVGVTGSVGKTSAKETLMACFEAAGLTAHGTVGNLNNHWGVPLTLARMPRATEAAVIEMGMNHAGEIAPLSELARPDVSLITTIAPAHLENFDSITGIAKAKAEIFAGQAPGTVAILPAETAEAAVLVTAAEQAGLTVRRFGVTTDCDYRLSSYTPGVDRSDVAIELAGQWMRVCLGVTGEHMAINATGVIGVCLALGLDADQVAPGLMRMRLMKGRGERRRIHLPTGPLLLIDESYNASPTAMTAALRSLGAIDPAAGGRRIAVLGDMLELGEEGPAFHAGLLKPLTEYGIDQVFTCGPQMQRLFDALPDKMRGETRATSAELAPVVIERLRPNDMVMVKGSLGSGMALVIKTIESAGGPGPVLLEALQDAF